MVPTNSQSIDVLLARLTLVPRWTWAAHVLGMSCVPGIPSFSPLTLLPFFSLTTLYGLTIMSLVSIVFIFASGSRCFYYEQDEPLKLS